MYMDGAYTTDESRLESDQPAEERELAEYLDELISALLAEKAGESSGADRRANEPVVVGPDPQGAEAAAALRPSADLETPRQEPPSRDTQARNTSRASMREELLALFANPERLSTPSAVAPYLRASTAQSPPGVPAPEPSGFLQRFLPQAARSPEPAPSGLAAVDDRLAGGFGEGSHLVSGRPGVGKTAFLESVGWEAVSARRPVLYYALKEGGVGAWTRLVSTLGRILGGPTMPLDVLRGRTLKPGQLTTLAPLDRVLQTSVLPWLSLFETFPGGYDGLSAFVGDVGLRAREAEERQGRVPLLLIDDLDHLLLLTGAQPLARLVSRLDDVLAADSMTGVIAMTTPGPSACEADELPAQTVLALVPASRSPHDAIDYVDLEIRKNTRTGWTGTLPLLLDRRSGLFAPRH